MLAPGGSLFYLITVCSVPGGSPLYSWADCGQAMWLDFIACLCHWSRYSFAQGTGHLMHSIGWIRT